MITIVADVVKPANCPIAALVTRHSRHWDDPEGFLRTSNWERALLEAEIDKRRFCYLNDWYIDIDAGSFGRWGW